MALREHPEPALDSGQALDSDDPDQDAALALADAAEAEALAVEARAAAARARAVQLRRHAEAAARVGRGSRDGADADEDEAPTTSPTTSRDRWARPWRVHTLAVATMAVLMVGSLVASGYIAWRHGVAAQKRQHAAEFVAAARQDVVALMSLDFNRSREDMQHIADNSTGAFKQHLPAIADQLAKGLQRSKIVTTVTVNDAALESMTSDAAVVLVAATTQAKEADGAPEPRIWHVAVSLLRDGGRPKMSRVEFVQ
jgi:Mce-associated membrane protein